MKAAKTITILLSCLLVGMIIGSIISGNMAGLIWYIILLVIDVIVGIRIQYSIDKSLSCDDSQFKGSSVSMHHMSAKDVQREDSYINNKTREICDEFIRNREANSSKNDSLSKFNEAFRKLKANGGARLVNNIKNDEAGRLLVDMCQKQSLVLLLYSFPNIVSISIEDLDGSAAIVYSFKYNPRSMCQSVFVFLVGVGGKLRLFTVETSFSSFVLCEYSGTSHLNYGVVELKNVPTRIKGIIGK